MPIRMHGAQTSMMNTGCRMTTVRKVLHVLGGHPVLEEVRKHAHRQRHEHVGEELQLPDLGLAPDAPRTSSSGRFWATSSEAATGPPSLPTTRNRITPPKMISTLACKALAKDRLRMPPPKT